MQIDSYLSYTLGGSDPSVTAGEMCKAMGEKLPKVLEGSNADDMGLFVTPASQYNKLRQMMGEEPVSIGRDQYVLTCDMGGELGDLYTKYMAGGHTLTLGGMSSSPQPISRTRTRRPSPTRGSVAIPVPWSLPMSCCPSLICSRIPVICSLTTSRGWM